MERNYGEDIAPIEVNSQDVTRVFLNLFGNGFYAANKRARDNAAPGFEPTVKVTTRDPGDAVEIRVRDNGIGIPAEIVDKLFQPFFTTRPTGEGTGLCLWISYDVVTGQHGGSDAVDSRVGGFTEFTIRLPRTRQGNRAQGNRIWRRWHLPTPGAAVAGCFGRAGAAASVDFLTKLEEAS